jgi:hypothetical protein
MSESATHADFINYKKGEEDRKANFSESLRERILTRFLTILDRNNIFKLILDYI